MKALGNIRFDWPDHPGSHAEALIRRGLYREALNELEPLLASEPDSCKLLRIKHQALMGLRHFGDAAHIMARALQLQPGNNYYRKLHAIAVKDSGDFSAALPLLEQALQLDPDDLELLAALCVVHFRLGNEPESLRFGQRKLDLLVKTAPAAPSTPLSQRPPGTRNVVSFSLWGDTAQYCHGAILNARQVPERLPGWATRFYVDQSVPSAVVRQLGDAGAEVVDATNAVTPRLMRRFLAHDDPEVERYLIRDSDSRIGSREIAAIAEWQASGLAFHAIRDHPFHNELIQGGLWGGTARQAFTMRELLDQFADRFGADERYGADQFFLGHFVWPRIRAMLLTHDSYYRSPGSRPFPGLTRGTDHDHVGMGLVLSG